MWKHFYVSVFLSLIVPAISQQRSNGEKPKICPPKDIKIDCYCYEEKRILDCPVNIPTRLPWNMQATFDTIATLAPSSKSEVYDKLELSGAPLTKQHPLRIEENTIAELKFREISIFSFDLIEYLHPNAFPGTYGTTELLKIQSHSNPETLEVFQFVAHFRTLKTLWLANVSVPQIPKHAFRTRRGGSSTLEDIDIINGGVERIRPNAFAGCPNLLEIDLQFNKLTAEGISEYAFEGISKETKVNLMHNSGLTSLPREKFEPFLDFTEASLSVGTLMDSGFDTTFYLHCDQRVDWICAKRLDYASKLFGYRCKDFEHEDIFSYCDTKEVEGLITTPAASSPIFRAPILLLVSAFTFSILQSYILN